jgi:20S proteasome, alpha and beta subunits
MNKIQWPLLLLILSGSIQCHVVVTASSAAGQETLIGIKGKDFVLLGADSSASSSITVTSSSMDKITLISNPFPFHGPRRRRQQQQQPIIAVASAGDKADCERLMGQLSMQATQMEYESGLGADISHVFHKNKENCPFMEKEEKGSKKSLSGGLDAETVAYLARDRIAKNMRSRNRLSVCLLVGGLVPTTAYRSNIVQGSTHVTTNREVLVDEIQAQVQAATSSFLTVAGQCDATMVRERVLLEESFGDEFYQPKLFWLDEYGSLLAVEYGAHGLGSNFILSILDRHYRSDMTRGESVQLLKDCFEQLRSRYIINSPNPPCIKCIDYNGCQIF